MFDGKIPMFQVSLVKSIKLQKHPLKSMGEKKTYPLKSVSKEHTIHHSPTPLAQRRRSKQELLISAP